VRRDVPGFVRLFYILLKKKKFRTFWKIIHYCWQIIPYFTRISRKFYVKIYFLSKSRISAQNRMRPRLVSTYILSGKKCTFSTFIRSFSGLLYINEGQRTDYCATKKLTGTDQ